VLTVKIVDKSTGNPVKNRKVAVGFDGFFGGITKNK
jgi:uncharacterized GH25 family protein